MKTVQPCLRCGRWFLPVGNGDRLCNLCKHLHDYDESRAVFWWWIAFTGAMIGILILLLL